MWYKVKIRYRSQDKKGDPKTRIETFLHEGTSLQDVAAQTLIVHQARIKELDTVSVNEAPYTDVHFQVGGKRFYDVTVIEKADEQERSFKCLIAADSLSDAEERTERMYRDSTVFDRVAGAVPSAVWAVWHPAADQWQSDFINRSEAMADDYRKGYNLSQMKIPFGQVHNN